METLSPEVLEDSCRVWAHPGRGSVQFFRDVIDLEHGLTVEVQLGYRRYLDFDKENATGQDAAGVRFNNSYLVAVVADGVSQSFFGDLAATHVSQWLLEELWRTREHPPEPSDLEKGLGEQEKILASVVETYPLDDVDRPLLRSALEAMRKSGSQAVFSALIWDLINQRGSLYQVGDVLGLVYFRDRDPISLKGSKGRWSSAQKSNLRLSQTPIVDPLGLLLSSDGLGKNWGADARNGLNEVAFSEMADSMAAYDDVSFVSAFVNGQDADKDFFPPAKSVEVFPLRGASQEALNSSAPEKCRDTQYPNGNERGASSRAVTEQARIVSGSQVAPTAEARQGFVSQPPLPTRAYRHGFRIKLHSADWAGTWHDVKVFSQGALFGVVVALLAFSYLWREGLVSLEREGTRVRRSDVLAGDSSGPRELVIPALREAHASDFTFRFDILSTAYETRDFLTLYQGTIPPDLINLLKSSNRGTVSRISVPRSLLSRVELLDGSRTLLSQRLSPEQVILFDGSNSFDITKAATVYLRLYDTSGDLAANVPIRFEQGQRCYDIEISEGTD